MGRSKYRYRRKRRKQRGGQPPNYKILERVQKEHLGRLLNQQANTNSMLKKIDSHSRVRHWQRLWALLAMWATEPRQDENNKEENDEDNRKAVEFGTEQAASIISATNTSQDTLQNLCRHDLQIKNTTIRSKNLLTKCVPSFLIKQKKKS